jgi:glucose-6-phosphate 1-dehydrogenase
MRKSSPCLIVIFGASGDLTERKLIPALYDLFIQGLVPPEFGILGVGRSAMTDESFREKMEGSLQHAKLNIDATPENKQNFLGSLYYTAINTSNAEDYAALRDRCAQLHSTLKTRGNVIYYLATPPMLYPVVAQNLKTYGLHEEREGQFTRLIVEKPFGTDLQSALELNKTLLSIFKETQIYRIDHYLGKETVQNLVVTRFSNGIFEPLWNRNYIHHVEITSSESIGVENRGGYYDRSGALRDMVQNHLLQICGLVAMEPPATFEADAIRNETLKVFQSLRPLTDEDIEKHVIRGQYTASKIRGECMAGYREESSVQPDSRTETYLAMKFYIDNWRWGGVPFYIRSGKRLPTRVTEVVIHFKQTPHKLFEYQDGTTNNHNQLIIRIQPDEGILLKLGMKVPGAGYNVQNVNMDFHYSDLSGVHLPEAYERLLLDCTNGDATLYARGDAVEACWKFVDPILNAWKSNPDLKVYGYPAGSWGPENADSLIEGFSGWRYPCKNLTDDGLYCEL